MKNTIIQVNHLSQDEYVEIQRKRKSLRPRFLALGVEKMDAALLLAKMGQREAYVYEVLVSKRDYRDNIAEFSPIALTKTEQNKFNKGFKLLVSKGVIKRVKRSRPSIYMFNPDFILPKDYNEALKKWESIK